MLSLTIQPYHGGTWIGLSVKQGDAGVRTVQHSLGWDPIHYLHNKVAGSRGQPWQRRKIELDG